MMLLRTNCREHSFHAERMESSGLQSVRWVGAKCSWRPTSGRWPCCRTGSQRRTSGTKFYTWLNAKQPTCQNTQWQIGSQIGSSHWKA